jgi:hypothetical protein
MYLPLTPVSTVYIVLARQPAEGAVCVFFLSLMEHLWCGGQSRGARAGDGVSAMGITQTLSLPKPNQTKRCGGSAMKGAQKLWGAMRVETKNAQQSGQRREGSLTPEPVSEDKWQQTQWSEKSCGSQCRATWLNIPSPPLQGTLPYIHFAPSYLAPGLAPM